jgi:sugar O-acyltransferase (sialic acid O-acetyltransferase NeuD family)
LILGTRRLATEIADLASEIAGYRVVGFVENEDRERCSETLDGLPIHWIDDIADRKDSHWAVCGLMTTHRKRFTDQVGRLGMPFATLVHPKSRVSPSATLGEGCIVSAGAVVAAHVRLGCHVFVNRGVLVGHHTEIGDLCSLGPGANIAGSCEIGRRVYFGSGAIVIDHIAVGERSVVGAGALVTKNVPEGVMVAGAPARIAKRDIDGR